MQKKLGVFYKVLSIILIFISLMNAASKVAYGANVMTDIRVGLISLYSKKSNITVKNKKIGLGYCIDEKYKVDFELYSETGFTFTPAKGYYYITNKTFKSYKDALSAAKTIEKLGVNAYATMITRNYYKVYVGGENNTTAMASVYEKIKGRYGHTYSTLQSDNNHRVLVRGKDVSLLIDAKKMGASPQIKALTSNSAGAAILNLGSRSYRGRVEIGRYGSDTLTAVNVINIESYLYGVVPAEMISSWPKEALKAQTVCARSFALMKTGYTADSNISKGFYLNDTTSHQVYKGYTAENSTTTQAVRETKGEVVTYNNKMITAYFSSTSGGRTESGSDVWGLKVPYYQSVVDIYETEPEKGPWIISYTKEQLKSKLTAGGFRIGTVKSINPEIITGSNRVYSLKVKGSTGSATLQSGSIRTILDLYSTKFKIIQYGDSPDKVSVLSASGKSNTNVVTSVNISNAYVISGDNKIKKSDSSLAQYVVKGASDLMNYPVSAPKNRDTYYFAGMGYGHGVGMSQSGAKGMAKAGYDYKEIISYYFSGCEVTRHN